MFNRSKPKTDVFISYRRVEPDAGYARRLYDLLREAGHSVFIDWDIPVGERWMDEITRALAAASVYIVLLSRETIESDMVRQEVKEAHALSRTRGIRIIPIWLNFSGPLPYDLAAYLGPFQGLFWNPSLSWDAMCLQIEASMMGQLHRPVLHNPASELVDPPAEDLRPLTSVPLPVADPRLDTGAVELHSAFYIVRAVEEQVLQLVAGGTKTILIKGPRQVGKTSLLCRAKAAAERLGNCVVYVDLQLVDVAHLASISTLTKYIAHRIASDLRTEISPSAVWDDFLGPHDSLSKFLRAAVLGHSRPFVLCLDELDRILGKEYRQEFFSMLRGFHNIRASDTNWRCFGLILAHSTEPFLFIDDLNESPFNVGDRFLLGDFTRAEIYELNGRHGNPLSTTADINALVALIGGHPFLMRLALHALATQRVSSVQRLIDGGADDGGLFGDHLRHHLFTLSHSPRVAREFRNLLAGKKIRPDAFHRLMGAGLVVGDTAETARPRCDLYRRYFSARL